MKISKETIRAFKAEGWTLDESSNLISFKDDNGIDPIGLLFRNEREAKTWLEVSAPIRRVQLAESYGIFIG